MVLLGRIELPTSPLPRVRSTTELQQRGPGHIAAARQGRAIVREGRNVKHGLRLHAPRGMSACMAPPAQPSSREARLAAKLRENLHRRKAQARALDRLPTAETAENDSAGLSKTSTES